MEALWKPRDGDQRVQAARSGCQAQAQHACAILLINAGVNAKAFPVMMVPATIAVTSTYDTHGPIKPGRSR